MNKTNILLASVLLAGCAPLQFTLPLEPVEMTNAERVTVTDLRTTSGIPITSKGILTAPTDATYVPTHPISDYIASKLVATRPDQEVTIFGMDVKSDNGDVYCNIVSSVTNGSQSHVRTNFYAETGYLLGEELNALAFIPCLDQHIADIQNAL